MPFTGSHPAAVLPFLGTPLPMSALVAGSMAPDSAYYVPGALFGYPNHTHSASGVVGINLLLGFLLWATWHIVVSGPALAAAPAAVRSRCGHLQIGIRARLRRPVDLLLVPAAVMIGAATHVALDSFTHPWGWAIPHSRMLGTERLGVPGWTWAQLGLSALGLLVLAVFLRRAWLRAPISPVPADRLLLAPSAVAAWWLIATAALIGALRGLYVIAVLGIPAAMMPWNVLTRSLGLAATVALVLAVLWHLGRIPRRPRSHHLV